MQCLSFLLPSQNQHFAYYCETDDDYYMADQGSYIADIKAGEQYLFICSYDSGTHGYSTATRYWNVTCLTFDEWYQNPNSRRISVHHEMSELLFMQNTNNAVYIKDLIKK